jgi:hypothetical protein
MEGLPECWSESFQQKATRFAKDVTAIGDELRSLLREVRKSYRDHLQSPSSDDWAMEAAYDDWQAYGYSEWFEPFSSVESSVFDNLAEWASRFHRAVRVVDVSNAIEGFSSPLDLDQLLKLSQCLTSNWSERVGGELMCVFGTLTDQLDAFTHAVDLWMFQGMVAEADGKEPTVNQLMVNILNGQKVDEFVAWSVTDWQDRLAPLRGGKAPSKSTIQGTAVWQNIQSLRKQTGAELLDHQTERDDHGNRRSRL